MCVDPIEITEEVIEPVALRVAGRRRMADAPLADYPGDITGAFQYLGNGDIFRLHQDA